VVIDVQNDFLARLRREDKSSLLDSLNELLAEFARRHMPIVFVDTEHMPDGSDALPRARHEGIVPAVRGTPGAASPQELLKPRPLRRITKTKYSIFFETEFGALAAKLPTPLIFAGVNTHACVRASLIDAVQRDLPVVIAQDCTASYEPAWHSESLQYFAKRFGPVLSNETIIRALDDGAEAAV